MKALKIIRNIVLILYLIIGIFAIVCTALGWSVTPIMSANSDMNVGSLLFNMNNGQSFVIPYLGYVVYYCWSLPGKIALGVIGALLLSTFFFGKGKKKDKVKAENEEEIPIPHEEVQLPLAANVNAVSNNVPKKEVSVFNDDDIFDNNIENNTFDNPVTGELIEQAISNINEESNIFANTSELSQNVKLFDNSNIFKDNSSANNFADNTLEDKVVAERVYTPSISQDVSSSDIFLSNEEQASKFGSAVQEDVPEQTVEELEPEVNEELVPAEQPAFEETNETSNVTEEDSVLETVDTEAPIASNDSDVMLDSEATEDIIETIEDNTNLESVEEDMDILEYSDDLSEVVPEENILSDADSTEVASEVTEVVESKEPVSDEEPVENEESDELAPEVPAVEDEYLNYYDELPTTQLSNSMGANVPLEDLYLEDDYDEVIEPVKNEDVSEAVTSDVLPEVTTDILLDDTDDEPEVLEVETTIDDTFEGLDVPPFDYANTPEALDVTYNNEEPASEAQPKDEIDTVNEDSVIAKENNITVSDENTVSNEQLVPEEKSNQILDEMKSKFTELENKYSLVSEENQKLNDKILNDAEVLERRKTEIKNLQNKLSVVNKENKERKSANAETLASLEALKEKLNNIENEKQENDKIQKKQLSEIERLKKLVEGAQEKNNSLLSQIENLKNSHKTKLEKLKLEADTAKKEKSSAAAELESNLMAYKQKNKQLEDSMRKVVELDEQNKALYEKTAKALEESKKEAKKSKADLDSLNSLYDELYKHYTQTVSYLVNIQLVSKEAFEREKNAFKH